MFTGLPLYRALMLSSTCTNAANEQNEVGEQLKTTNQTNKQRHILFSADKRGHPRTNADKRGQNCYAGDPPAFSAP